MKIETLKNNYIYHTYIYSKKYLTNFNRILIFHEIEFVKLRNREIDLPKGFIWSTKRREREKDGRQSSSCPLRSSARSGVRAIANESGDVGGGVIRKGQKHRTGARVDRRVIGSSKGGGERWVRPERLGEGEREI